MAQHDSVAKKLKEFFKERGITQTQAAELLETSQQVVQKLLKDRPFGKRTAAKWSEVFGINPAWLLTGVGEMFLEDEQQRTNTTKKVVEESNAIVASEVLRLINNGELYPASVVAAKDALIEAKEKEIQRLNRELGALRNELEQYQKSASITPASIGATMVAELESSK